MVNVSCCFTLSIKLPERGVQSSRLASLARFAGTAKVSAICRLATLVAFTHCLEATAHDDVKEALDMLLHDFFNDADKKVRLLSIMG